MNKKFLPFAALVMLLALGVGWLVVKREFASARAMPRQQARQSADTIPPQSVPGPKAAVAGAVAKKTTGARSGRDLDRPERRDVAEVFPDSAPPAGDWRNRHPGHLRISPYPGVTVAFTQVQVKEDGRHLTWIGRNPDLPGASFVGVATPDGYDAVMIMPGAAQYNFHVRDDRVLVEEVTATGDDCELGPGRVLAAGLPVPPGVFYAEAGGSASQVFAENSGPASPVEAPLTVDVLFLYNTRALAVAAQRSGDPIGYIDGYARAGLETCNQVLVNSRIDNFAWRYVGLVAVPEYAEKQTVSEDVAMIAPEGPFNALVRAARAEYGADQVLMWTGAGFRQGSSFAGQVRSQPVPVEYAVAGLRLTAGILILAHELAHNFGCHHDRGHAGTGDGSTATPEGDGLWCYGLLWNNPVGATTSGTVMAYGDFLVPYFSNPDTTLHITSTLQNRPGPVLDLGTRAIGFPETDPRAANNARIMREHAAHMAALSEETEAMPVILQQPRDAAVLAGQVMTLSVSATGGGLTYQWLKDGAGIEGATATVLSKTFAQADAGNYSVRISNRRGAVTSRSAAVTLVTSAPPPVVPPSAPVAAPAAGGGGGGGGAPSLWFYLALLMTALVRFGSRRQ
jgi:hypothetical protein